MLKSIEVQNFKLFREKTIFSNLKRLNFLTGINGRGKSSMLQTLLLVAQSVTENKFGSKLLLNGCYANLGNGIDIKNDNTSRDNPIFISFETENSKFEYYFSFENENDQALSIDHIIVNGVNYDLLTSDIQLEDFVPQSLKQDVESFFHNVAYVSAERIGPQLHYSHSNNKQIVGPQGEFTACALYNNKDLRISDEFVDGIIDLFPELLPEDLDHSMAGQVQFWLSLMFKDVQIETQYINEANEYVMKFYRSDSRGKFKPTNVGYGYSFALPIIVAGLLAEKGSVLIVENPEAHLHPKAQNIIGKFMSLLSENGVQVFVETHSEHIINATRVLLVQEAFDVDNLNIMYFDDADESYYKHIVVNEDGLIENWPDGFFDQSELDNNIILGI